MQHLIHRLGWPIILALFVTACSGDPLQPDPDPNPPPTPPGNPPPPPPPTPPPPPPSGSVQDSIPIIVHRTQAGSGTALVSNGVPLPAGLLQVAQLDSLRVTFSGTETAIYLEALDGRWPDGTIKSLLIQFQIDVSQGTDITDGQVEIGRTRGTTDLARTTPPRSPVAIAVPVVVP